jgi:hypothetical protein
VRSSRTLIGAAFAVVAALSIAGGVAASSTVVVRPGDVGMTWLASARPGGSSSFVTGPATAPLGIGSLQFTTSDVHASAQLFNYSYIGTPLANFNAMSYSAYRASSSTNPTTQTIALALEVDVNGSSTAGGLATLIFEPDYQAGGNGAMKTDTWQSWDAYDGGNAVWWATEDIPGAPVAYNTFVSWSTILAANPDAIIVGGVGFFVGSGWDGQFTGYADALTIGVGGNTTTYNFEPKTQLVVTAPDATKVQGDAIPAFTPTYSGFLYGDTAANLTTQPTCATTASAGSPVGTYPIICSGGASDNYSFTYTPGSLQVIPGETATPTAGPTQIVEGATGTPSRAITPPPTSASGNLSSGGDSTPLWAVFICLAFGSLGLLVGAGQRRRIRL